jgi:hypothetical protein
MGRGGRGGEAAVLTGDEAIEPLCTARALTPRPHVGSKPPMPLKPASQRQRREETTAGVKPAAHQ